LVIMTARETAELLLLVGRLVQADSYEGELSPAQWMALRFFARANSFSRTPSAFAEFQATTRGTASQAIKALEAGGYLVRQRSQADGRSVTLRLTDKGHQVVARDPFEVLVRAVDSLNVQEQAAMRDALHQVLTTIAASGAHRHFGVCQDCVHLGGEMNADSMGTRRLIPECLLFGAPIEPDDTGLLCVHFRPKTEHREDGHLE
jgi:DNA-binding MarR family transcriptional regulator